MPEMNDIRALYTLMVSVAPTVSRSDLILIFSTYGKVEQAMVVCNPENRHPHKEWTATSGIAFVRFSSHQEAKSALEAMNSGNYSLKGSKTITSLQVVRCTWAKKDMIVNEGPISQGDHHSGMPDIAPSSITFHPSLLLGGRMASEFICKIDKDFHLVVQPILTQCAHIFCRTCYENSLKKHAKNGIWICPLCKQETSTSAIVHLSNIKGPMSILKKLYSALEIRCPSVIDEEKKRMCNWTGLLADVYKHMTECNYFRVHVFSVFGNGFLNNMGDMGPMMNGNGMGMMPSMGGMGPMNMMGMGDMMGYGESNVMNVNMGMGMGMRKGRDMERKGHVTISAASVKSPGERGSPSHGGINAANTNSSSNIYSNNISHSHSFDSNVNPAKSYMHIQQMKTPSMRPPSYFFDCNNDEQQHNDMNDDVVRSRSNFFSYNSSMSYYPLEDEMIEKNHINHDGGTPNSNSHNSPTHNHNGNNGSNGMINLSASNNSISNGINVNSNPNMVNMRSNKVDNTNNILHSDSLGNIGYNSYYYYNGEVPARDPYM